MQQKQKQVILVHEDGQRTTCPVSICRASTPTKETRLEKKKDEQRQQQQQQKPEKYGVFPMQYWLPVVDEWIEEIQMNDRGVMAISTSERIQLFAPNGQLTASWAHDCKSQKHVYALGQRLLFICYGSAGRQTVIVVYCAYTGSVLRLLETTHLVHSKCAVVVYAMTYDVRLNRLLALTSSDSDAKLPDLCVRVLDIKDGSVIHTMSLSLKAASRPFYMSVSTGNSDVFICSGTSSYIEMFNERGQWVRTLDISGVACGGMACITPIVKEQLKQKQKQKQTVLLLNDPLRHRVQIRDDQGSVCGEFPYDGKRTTSPCVVGDKIYLVNQKNEVDCRILVTADVLESSFGASSF